MPADGRSRVETTRGITRDFRLRKFWGHGGDPLRPSVRRACDRDGLKGSWQEEGQGEKDEGWYSGHGLGQAATAATWRRFPVCVGRSRGGGGGFPESFIVGGLQATENNSKNDRPRISHSWASAAQQGQRRRTLVENHAPAGGKDDDALSVAKAFFFVHPLL